MTRARHIGFLPRNYAIQDWLGLMPPGRQPTVAPVRNAIPLPCRSHHPHPTAALQ